MALGLKLVDSATWVRSLGDRSTWAVRRRFLQLRNNHKKKGKKETKNTRDFSKLQSVKRKVES